MKAIFIDAKKQTVSLIEVENDLQAIYDKIGCLLVQTVPFAGENIVCDEEGRLKPPTAGFKLGSWRIVGNALIVGDTEDGNFADTKLSAEEIAKQIRFFGEDEPLPPPKFRVIGL